MSARLDRRALFSRTGFPCTGAPGYRHMASAVAAPVHRAVALGLTFAASRVKARLPAEEFSFASISAGKFSRISTQSFRPTSSLAVGTRRDRSSPREALHDVAEDRKVERYLDRPCDQRSLVDSVDRFARTFHRPVMASALIGVIRPGCACTVLLSRRRAR
jgi:hypothetical protein